MISPAKTLESRQTPEPLPAEGPNRLLNRRVVAADRGGPEVLTIVEEPLPEPAHGEVRVKILATGVSYADLLMREGVHPETPHGPITLGWDLVGVVDKLGAGVGQYRVGEVVAALPMLGGYADYACLRPGQLVPVPDGVDPAEAVVMVLNYVTAYQMLHRSAQVQAEQKVLIHGAAGGIGTALLQLGHLMALTMYGTASSEKHGTVIKLGGIPIDYKNKDFVTEIGRLTHDGVDAVFDGVGGTHVWQSFKTLRRGGTVVSYGLTSSLRRGRLVSGPRYRFRGLLRPLLYAVVARSLQGRRRIRAYSIQRRMWRHPDWFRDDLTTLFKLLREREIEPLIAACLPLAKVKEAHNMLAGGVEGKIVLLCGYENAQ